MRSRNDRQDAIREIIRSQQIRTQRDLVNALKQVGFACTQATVSRDITDMGLRKLPEGTYALAEDMYMQRMVSELVTDVTCANNLVVVRTGAGTANGVASSMDEAGLPEVLGTIAGDDTILVICKDEETARSFEASINRLRTYH